MLKRRAIFSGVKFFSILLLMQSVPTALLFNLGLYISV